MNRVHLAGYLTKDPQIEYHGDNNFASAKFTVACNRPFKNKEGKYDADFIPCNATNKVAELIEKHFHKGSYIIISDGWWKTGNYTNKEGNKVYYHECQVMSIEFGNKPEKGSQSNDAQQTIPETKTDDDGFVDIPKDSTGDIPFFATD